jgi:hypothetical protein
VANLGHPFSNTRGGTSDSNRNGAVDLFNLTVNLYVVLSIPGNYTSALNDSTSAAFLSYQDALCKAVSISIVLHLLMTSK